MTARAETAHSARRRVEEELAAEQDAQDDYQNFLHDEADRIEQRGFQPKVLSLLANRDS